VFEVMEKFRGRKVFNVFDRAVRKEFESL